MELVKITKNTRGKNAHEVSFQGIGRFETKSVNKEVKGEDGTVTIVPTDVETLITDGVLTSNADMLNLVANDEQKVRDYFAIGYNRAAYQAESDKDELDPYVQGLSEEMADATKRAIRALSKATGLDLVAAAEVVASARQ